MRAFKELWLRFGVALNEPGTWRGIIRIVMAIGIIEFSREQQEAIVVAGLALSGLIGVFFKDESNPAPALQKSDDALAKATSLEELLRRSRDESDSESGV